MTAQIEITNAYPPDRIFNSGSGPVSFQDWCEKEIKRMPKWRIQKRSDGKILIVK